MSGPEYARQSAKEAVLQLCRSCDRHDITSREVEVVWPMIERRKPETSTCAYYGKFCVVVRPDKMPLLVALGCARLAVGDY